MNLIASAIYAKEVMVIWQGNYKFFLKFIFLKISKFELENRNKGKVDNYQWGRCIYIAAVSGWILVLGAIMMFWASRNEKDDGKIFKNFCQISKTVI